MLNKPKERILRLNGKSFSSMSNLMLLKISNVDFSEDQIYLSNDLRFFKWHGCPLKTLPSNFQAHNLFELNLRRSQIKYLWKGMKAFPKLKTIKLSYSHNFTETPDFIMIPNLEMLDLEGCTRLHKVHESVGALKSLIVLNLKGCNSLQSFLSDVSGLKSLKNLNLQGCSKLDKLPENLGELEGLEELDVGATAIKQVPSSIAQLTNLQKLSFQKCNSQPWWSYLWRRNPRCLVLPSLTVAEGCHLLEDVSLRGCTSPAIALHLFNCPKLIQNRGHQENNLAVMLLKQCLQQWGNHLSNQCHISIPGNKIPEWFSFKSDENLVKIGLLPNWLNDEFMGIAMCGVLTLDHEDFDGRKIDAICGINIIGNSYLFSFAPHSFTTFESDHLWLAYLPREKFEHERSLTLESSHVRRWEYEEYDSTNSVLVSTSTCIHAWFEVTTGQGGYLNSKASKCGIRLVYKQDIECSEDLPATEGAILHQHNNCSTFYHREVRLYMPDKLECSYFRLYSDNHIRSKHGLSHRYRRDCTPEYYSSRPRLRRVPNAVPRVG
ncbi:hypothetical protein LWI29_008804 [Acer saccharum]|uniref:Uncharacterized protein n=1 Tax=Acer saccharum TaxID=4024 RepID=A0AA39VVA6_ACESA|nr:hypothetical protein LWI29_008804 [Acer saccharum]